MFVKRPFRAGYLVQWNARMSKDNPIGLVDKVVEAVFYHQGIPFEHTSEYRSVYSYDKLWESLEHYSPEHFLSNRNDYLKAGLQSAFRLFSRPETVEPLRPVNLLASVETLLSDLSIKDTSSGLTSYGLSKYEAFTVGLDKAVDIISNDKAPAPALAGVRTQRKGKTRLVWNIPLEIVIIEATVARGIIDNFKNRKHVMTFGDTSLELGSRIRKSASMCKSHVSIDYSQFDASVRPDIIHEAFNALRTWYDQDSEVYPGVTVSKVFDIIERYFICTPIVMPNREGKFPTLVTGKRGGVPSGSYFTSIVDSFANVAAIIAASTRFKFNIGDDDLYVLGDDCLFFTNQEVDMCKLSGFLSSIGFKTNPSKGSFGPSTDRIEYLGRTWRNGFPIRPYSHLTRGSLYPEKYRKYSTDAGVREFEAINVAASYLLTSFVEDAPIGLSRLKSICVTSNMTSGLTRYLMSEGLIPGKVVNRAIY